MNISIREEILNSNENHIREVSDFVCGPETDALEQYIKSDAFEDAKNNREKIYLIKDNDNNLIGYYSLRATSIYNSLNNKIKAIPLIELSTFAINYDYQRKKYGTVVMLKYVFGNVNRLSEIMGCQGIITFAMNSKAEKFYETVGFEKLELQDYSMLIDTFEEGCTPMMLPLEYTLAYELAY